MTRTVTAPPTGSWLTDPYLLREMLRCAGCGNAVLPLATVGGPRRYACRFGCRMVPLSAEALEARVWRETCRIVPDRAAAVPRPARAGLISEVFSAITVGGGVTDLTYARRT